MKIEFRPITIDDLPFRQKWLNDSKINYYLGNRVRQSTDEIFHQNWFKAYFEDEKIGKRKIFTILADQEPIGQVGLTDIDNDDENAGLYIIIGEKEYWSKGVAEEAIDFIQSYAKKDLGLHKINLYVHALNKRAIGLYKKMGYSTVGISYDNVKRGDDYEDEVIMENIL